MNRYDGGYGRGRGPDRPDPYGGGPARPRQGQGQGGDRPWMGGYRGGYQGGSGGYRTSGPPRPRYGGDYWWMGERAYPPPAEYDRAYRDFDRQTHPRYSPVGGMYHAMGGEYQYRPLPRPLREDTWFSDWTRWF